MRLTKMVSLKDVRFWFKLDELKRYIFRTCHNTVHLPEEVDWNETTLERRQDTSSPQV